MHASKRLPPVPASLASRPFWHGLPVPYIALITKDGEPDFRVTDERARRKAINDRLCQLCGVTLGRNIFFVGGPSAAEAMAYFEPAAHLGCLLYAMQVCPFIAGRKEHADTAAVAAEHPDLVIKEDDTYSTVKSSWWVIIKSRSWRNVRTPGGTLLLRPHPVVMQTAPLHAESMGPADWRELEKSLL